AASSMTTAGSIIQIAYTGRAGRNVGRVYSAVGAAAELVAVRNIEQIACAVPKVGEPLRRGRHAVLWKSAGALALASLALSLAPGESRRKRVAAGILGAAGSLCMRLAVHYLTDVSALDPRAVSQQQRRGMGAAG